MDLVKKLESLKEKQRQVQEQIAKRDALESQLAAKVFTQLLANSHRLGVLVRESLPRQNLTDREMKTFTEWLDKRSNQTPPPNQLIEKADVNPQVD